MTKSRHLVNYDINFLISFQIAVSFSYATSIIMPLTLQEAIEIFLNATKETKNTIFSGNENKALEGDRDYIEATASSDPPPPTHDPALIPKKNSTRVIIKDRREAFLEALLMPSDVGDTSHLTLWTDASLANKRGRPVGRVGWAVMFRRRGTWVRMMGRSTNNGHTSNSGELLAIDHALDFAVQLVQGVNRTRKPGTVRILTDSQFSLRDITDITGGATLGRGKRRRPETEPKKRRATNHLINNLLVKVAQRSQSLEESDVNLEFRWVPRDEVQGNILADQAAKESRKGHNMACEDKVLLDWNIEVEALDQHQLAVTGAAKSRKRLM
ncbi:hypothetical protein BGZ63DRAFT_187816 [Mariannaea sp. PMI_226]|nr:hypothetical protein BGZ63DRAFT_187816 [Mariannaea sp. PMI_226]